METKGLIFIPDISGFTRFVNETEIEHSRLIIQELLETLISANSIGLEISEIEGDAILFTNSEILLPLKSCIDRLRKCSVYFIRTLQPTINGVIANARLVYQQPV